MTLFSYISIKNTTQSTFVLTCVIHELGVADITFHIQIRSFTSFQLRKTYYQRIIKVVN